MHHIILSGKFSKYYLDSILPPRLRRIRRELRRQHRHDRIHQKHRNLASTLVRQTSIKMETILQISSAQEQLDALRVCVSALKLAGHDLPSVPYSRFCPHYQLCCTYIAMGKCFERCDNLQSAQRAYSMALRECDYSVEARVLLASMIRDQATSQEELALAEQHLNDAVDANKALEELLFEQGIFQRTPELAREFKAAAAADNHLALLLSQEGREQEASIPMKRRGFRYQLAHEVLHYPLDDSSRLSESRIVSSAKECSRYAVAIDCALPASMRLHLLQVFGPTSSFWREHDYANPDCGYFSYLHPLRSATRMDEQPTTLDAVIQHVHNLVCLQFPAAKKAKYAEWWSHCRRHSKGHQLHFDSDNEGEGANGPRHPIISTVIYLTLAGGPTLITNQTLKSSTLADKGWLVHPRENRLAMFDANYLHGVVPGRSFSPPATSVPTSSTSSSSFNLGLDENGLQRAPDGTVRRTTFMIAFWEEIVTAQRRCDGRPGAAIPFPRSDLAESDPKTQQLLDDIGVSRHCWPDQLDAANPSNQKLMFEWRQDADEQYQSSPKLGLPIPVGRVWDAVGGDSQGRKLLAKELPLYNLCFQGF